MFSVPSSSNQVCTHERGVRARFEPPTTTPPTHTYLPTHPHTLYSLTHPTEGEFCVFLP
eukprot:m.264138 g.264138  ORF g.264138 m.264138 type:complete len:59 (+) comp54178_c0_seq1:68-244(+)